MASLGCAGWGPFGAPPGFHYRLGRHAPHPALLARLCEDYRHAAPGVVDRLLAWRDDVGATERGGTNKRIARAAKEWGEARQRAAWEYLKQSCRTAGGRHGGMVDVTAEVRWCNDFLVLVLVYVVTMTVYDVTAEVRWCNDFLVLVFPSGEDDATRMLFSSALSLLVV